MRLINLNETFKSYVNINENLDICREWTEDNIVSDTLDSDEKEVEDQQIEPCTITSKGATLALQKLYKYIESNEGI